MIKKYLESKREEVEKNYAKVKEEFEHNQIAMVEAKNKIIQLDNSEDDAIKIFSVRTREKEIFKTQEIRDLESRITIYVTENLQNKKLMKLYEDELKIIDQCFTQLEDVSRETSDINTQVMFDTAITEIREDNNVSRETLSDINTDQIVNRLKLCKNLVNVDNNRVLMELESIIKELSK
ncbi:MAG: hypothetical protein K6G85_05155 [Eubacterium sp.]|nr:hypothetical protein [Eubacterium sp.]